MKIYAKYEKIYDFFAELISVSDCRFANFFLSFCKTGIAQVGFCVQLCVNILRKLCFFEKKIVILRN
jgi:hypothetical protein